MLPTEILAIITLYSGDRVVAWVLRNHLPEHIYRAILLTKRRVLIYGRVQSGKTAEIMDVLQRPLYTHLRKIIIVQNSLLVLHQYRDRLTAAKILFQIVHNRTKTITEDVVLIMNNTKRTQYYLDAQKENKNYVLIMDEADAYGKHILADEAVHEYYVTATPHNKLYKTPEFFHRIQQIDPPPLYQGLEQVNITYNDNTIDQIVTKFQQDTPEGGMMLINSFKYVVEMQTIAALLSKNFKNIHFVTLNYHRKLFIAGKSFKIKRKKTIANIIDMLKTSSHIVFIANRMSLRGLSYVSGNYTRHLTHQYSDLRDKNITNALQRMRIFGIYRDQTPVQLILPSDNQKIISKMYANLDVDFDINRSFGSIGK
jgi:hypothetical protein